MRLTCRAVMIALLLQASVTSAGTQPARRKTMAGSGVISPAVVATWWAHQIDSDSSRLDLLALWRGSPGWFLRGGGSKTGGVSTDAEVFTGRIQYGDVEAELVFDARARTITFRGREIPLGDANVILLDGVDSAEGPHVVGHHRVEPVMPNQRHRPELLLRQSQDLLDYLRCDVRLPDPKTQEHMEFLCAMILGNCDVRFADASLQRMFESACRPSDDELY